MIFIGDILPKLNQITKADSLRKRIQQLRNNEEVDARDLNLLLEEKYKKKFLQLWNDQKNLRQIKRPEILKPYELIYKQIAVLVAKYETAVLKKKTSSSIEKLRNPLIENINKLFTEIENSFLKDSSLLVWIDRDLPDKNMKLLLPAAVDHGFSPERLLSEIRYVFSNIPILVSSTSKNKLCSQAEKFNWRTKREIWIDICEEALLEYSADPLAELERILFQKEVRAAKLFIEAYFQAKDEGRDPIAAGNKILVQRGLKAPEIKVTKRDREIEAMEAEILKYAESQMSDSEREQLEILREHEENVAKMRKKLAR